MNSAFSSPSPSTISSPASTVKETVINELKSSSQKTKDNDATTIANLTESLKLLQREMKILVESLDALTNNRIDDSTIVEEYVPRVCFGSFVRPENPLRKKSTKYDSLWVLSDTCGVKVTETSDSKKICCKKHADYCGVLLEFVDLSRKYSHTHHGCACSHSRPVNEDGGVRLTVLEYKQFKKIIQSGGIDVNIANLVRVRKGKRKYTEIS